MEQQYQTPIMAHAAADVGPRDVLEDYAVTDQFITAGGLFLQVGIVCDGVGGVKSGERAAYMTAHATIDYMRNSPDTNIPNLMTTAVQQANYQVVNDDTSGKSTIAMMVVHFDGRSPYGRLYVASVGDSNIFLIRQGDLKRLNTDHNVANEMVIKGEATKEYAYSLQNAFHLTRAIGVKPEVEVDTGFYFNAQNRQQAVERGRVGVVLEEGDTIFACSDGLTDAGKDGLPYVREEEFLEHAMEDNAERTAKMYLSYALRRGTHDNVSVALMFVESKQRKSAFAGETVTLLRGIPTKYAVAGIFLLLLVFAGVVFALTSILGREASESEAQLKTVTAAFEATMAEETIIAQELTATAIIEAAFTPTPSLTPTPSPTSLPQLSVGQAGFWFDSSREAQTVEEGDVLEASEPIYVSIGDFIEGVRHSYFYFQTGSAGEFSSVEDDEIQFFLHEDSDVFIETEGYLGNGVEIELDAARDALLVVRGSCMAVQQSGTTVTSGLL